MEGVNSAKARSSMLSQVADASPADQNFAPSSYPSPASSLPSERDDGHPDGPPPDQMAIPSCPPFAAGRVAVLQIAAPSPPVTRSTLRELDLNWIMYNISLRVDVNYDHDLHFMPIEGPDGEQKRDDARTYWRALAAEFRIYQHSLSDCPSCGRRPQGGPVPSSFAPRLPTMFEALRELLETLVPDRDHPQIAENLDVPLLMQQVQKGVLDIGRLSRWIADLLKSHCAPMRDEWADEMASKIDEGWKMLDMELIVEGLEKLFSFLEAMKLDVANHQIRTFRFPLIEDTVSFQHGYFGRKLQDRKISAAPSQDWYREARHRHQKCRSHGEHGRPGEPFGALVHGILGQCTQQETIAHLPDTLAYDWLRMRQLQEDVHDIIYWHICMQAFNTLLRQRFGPRTVAPQTYATLQWRLTIIIENDAAESRAESWQAQLGHVAMEITRAAYAEGQQGDGRIPDDDFERTTRHLHAAVTRTFGSLAKELHARLEERTLAHAAIFREQSPLQISEAQKQWQESRHDAQLWRADVEDVARRVAHMAVLHWKIWAGLVYLEGEGGGQEKEEGQEGQKEGENENEKENEEDGETEKEDIGRGESMIQDENPPTGPNSMPFKSSKVIAPSSDWTRSIDNMSMVDEGGGDLM